MDDETINRARRRMLKLTTYVPPMIISLTAMRAEAGRMAPTAAAAAKAGVQVNTHAAAKAQAKIG